MTTLEQAARQALDALETVIADVKTTPTAYEAQRQSIEALRQALENHESAYQRGYLDGMAKPCIDCADRKLQAMKQPKQEPVAWLDEERNIVYMHNTHKTDDYHGFKRTTPLYTEPPKREWVGLTDEDEEHCQNEAAVKYRRYKSSIRGQLITPADCYEWHLIRAVEAKLKELNT